LSSTDLLIYSAATIALSAVLASAVWTVAIHLHASGGTKLIDESCPPAAVETFSRRYGTSIGSLDSFLCGVVSFFQTSLQDTIKDFTTIFLLGGPTILFALLLESSRSDRPFVASFPLVVGVITQFFTGAIVISLGWTLFVVQACYKGTRQGRKPVSRADVEAALLAIFIGYVIPTAWMLVTHDIWAIILWQPFPIYISIIQNAWSFLRRDKRAASGVDLAQLGFLLFSLLGTGAWVNILWPHVSLNAPFEFLNWLPPWSIPDPQTTTLSSTVLHLLQYDMTWIFVSTILTSLFLLNSVQEAFFVVQIAPAVTAIFGPAALVGGLWMFREAELVAQAEKEASKATKSE
jgi:hypothetical protein